MTCHTPHASDRPGLVAGDARAVCLKCHQPIKDLIAHSVSTHPAKAGGCSICHDPHQSGNPSLLRAKGTEVCAKCHKGHAQFGHPMGGGVTDPRTGKEMTCLSCHDPHGTQFKMTLRGDPQRGLCVSCHSAGEEQHQVMRGRS